MKRKTIYEIVTDKANSGDLNGAKKILKELLKTNKNDIKALQGMSTACLINKDFEESLLYTERLIALFPQEGEFQKWKIVALLNILQIEKAISSIETLKKINPLHPDIENLLSEAEMLQQDQKENQINYLAKRFDTNASSYDAGRKSNQYDTPKLLLESLQKNSKDKLRTVLDLGCGTGLSGSYLREKAQHLIGLDVSEKMLQIAAQKNIYDELINKDVLTYLEECKEKSIDAVIAASVIIYFGDLSKLFFNIKRVLSENGIFCFDVLTQDFGKWSCASLNGRIYQHNPEYIKHEVIFAGMQCNYIHTSNFKYITSDRANPGAIFTIIKN